MRSLAPNSPQSGLSGERDEVPIYIAVSRATELLDVQPGARVLEVGFGPGVGIQLLADKGVLSGMSGDLLDAPDRVADDVCLLLELGLRAEIWRAGCGLSRLPAGAAFAQARYRSALATVRVKF
jgi:hypothetical protein